jgi:hypothetical protein
MRENAEWVAVYRQRPIQPLPCEHDPEKWIPVFGKDHAPPMMQSGMTIRR